MDLQRLISIFQVNAISTLGASLGALVLIAVLLSLGRRFDYAVRLETFGIPIALCVGAVSLIVGPYGAFHLLPEEITDIWIRFPTPLLALVFGTLMLGRPIPKGKGLVLPVASQSIFALLLGLGQYFVGGMIVLLILIPTLGVDPLMGCLIEVGFEGGHGAAAIMGQSFAKLGFSGGLDLGLAMATIGLLLSTIIGSLLVIIGRIRGWVVQDRSTKSSSIEIAPDNLSFKEQLQQLLLNLAFIGLAVLFGVASLIGIRFISQNLGDLVKEAAYVFPVFPLALLGSLVIRFTLEKLGKTHLISSLLQREIGILATDLLIITAMAGLNLPLLRQYWLPLTILSFGGLTWNLIAMFLIARTSWKEEWFERSITEFGNATGVAASGLLLLRIADPMNRTNTLPIFSIKQLFLQPFLSGGIITVIAPLAIIRLGLLGWTEVCGLLTLVCIVLVLYLPTSTTQES